MHIFYCNTPIHRETLLQFLQFTENITPTERLFILDTVLRRATRLLKVFSTARPSTPKNLFDTLVRAVLDKKVLARLSTARPLK